MKVLLSFAVSLLLTANCFAASPSFGSFYTNHFTTNGLLIRAKLNPTQFDTNASSITITITNVAGVGGLIWTNSLGVIKPTSGQTTNALEYISGSADASTNTLLTLDTVNTWTTQATRLLDLRHQGTNVALWTPYGTVGIGKSADAWWGGFTRDDVLIGVHDSALGESDYTYFYLANVDDALSETNYADLLVTLETSGLSPSADINLVAVATNDVSRFNVFLQPDQGVAQIKLINRGGEIFKVTDHGGTYIGAYSETIFGPLSSGEAIVSIRDVGEGEADYNGIIVGTKDGDNQGRAQLETDGTPSANLHLHSTTLSGVKTLSIENGDTYFSIRAQAVGGEHLFRMEPNDPDGEVPYLFGTADTISSNPIMEIENNTTNILTFGPDDRINFGVGTTNGLFRDLNALWYQNATGSLGVRVDPANYIKFIMFGGTAPHINASSTIYIDNNIVTKVISPDTDDAYDIGLDGNPGAYQDIYLKGIAYLQGANDYAGNLTRLQVEHTGTAINFNSAASGTGVAQDFFFQDKGTNLVQISVGDGITNAFSVMNILGTKLNITFNPGDNPVIDATPGKLIFINNGTVYSNDLYPAAGSTVNAGQIAVVGQMFNDVVATNFYSRGSLDGSGASTLRITHTGLGNPIEYTSSSSVVGTGPSPHVFKMGSTNVVKIDNVSAAGETRLWLYDEDNGTMERVSVGIADSGGLGYKLLRIPN